MALYITLWYLENYFALATCMQHLFSMYADPFIPYNVSVYASTVAGESVSNTIVIYTEHGGMLLNQ